MSRKQNPGTCRGCGALVDERCDDDRCRACHVSLTFQECVDGSWARRVRREAGLPVNEEG